MAAQAPVETIKLAGNSCAVSSSREQTFAPGPTDEETFSQEAPETLTPQEKDEKRGIMRRISKYKALFGTECADLDLDPRSLDALVLEDLRDRARDTEYLVSTRRSAAAARGMFLGALATGEVVGPIIGLNLTNLAMFASRSEELLLCVDECAIKYDTMVAVDPAVRLALAVCNLAIAVNDRNSREVEKPPQDNVSGSANVSATPLN
jgi:hypothetical protein